MVRGPRAEMLVKFHFVVVISEMASALMIQAPKSISSLPLNRLASGRCVTDIALGDSTRGQGVLPYTVALSVIST